MNLPQRWIASALLLAALADPVTGLDLAVRDALQAHRGGPIREQVMRAATDAGNPRNLFAVMVVVAALGGPTGPVIVREALVTLIPANLVVEGLKRAVDRTRPDGSRDRNNASFPSSHAANAFAIAWLVWRRWPRAGWAAWPLATVVAFSRMWLDRHYLSDVVVGIGIGLAAAAWGTSWARGAGRRWVESGRYGKG
jgi:undecaprenyl-diphosphatase